MTSDHVTPYDRFALTDLDIEGLLVTGGHRHELIDYFGAAEYRELTRLARQAARTTVADESLRVILVPGIMGSQLGLVRNPPLPNDILWVDPIDIIPCGWGCRSREAGCGKGSRSSRSTTS